MIALGSETFVVFRKAAFVVAGAVTAVVGIIFIAIAVVLGPMGFIFVVAVLISSLSLLVVALEDGLS